MIYSEEEVDSVADQDFKCVGCRPPKKIYRAKLTEKKDNETIIDTQGKIILQNIDYIHNKNSDEFDEDEYFFEIFSVFRNRFKVDKIIHFKLFLS